MEYRIISLSTGESAMVDPDDFEKINKYFWWGRHDYNTIYARRRIFINNKEKQIQMHREILNAPIDIQVDHINGNGLDNRKCNLRLCSNLQNSRNRRPNRNTLSKYKGVTLDKKYCKWVAQITVKSRIIYLGRYFDELQAAAAYDEAAKKYFGAYAFLNISN